MSLRNEFRLLRSPRRAFFVSFLILVSTVVIFLSFFDGHLMNHTERLLASSRRAKTMVSVTIEFESKTRTAIQKSTPIVKSRSKNKRKNIPTLTENKSIIVNLNVDRRKFCSASFEYGEMCPKFYSDLGRCDYENGKLNCSDIRSKVKVPYRQTQIIATRMLRIFHLIAEKHGIRYWLASGTLLGAARHKGNIPWDTDADIEMPLEDYIKFFKYAAKDLPEDIFFQNSISDPSLRPSDSDEAAAISHKEVGIYRRTWNPRLRDKNSCNMFCIEYDCNWHDGIMIDIFVLDEEIGKEYFPLKKMEFEGFLFNVPSNWNEILEDLYGSDYMYNLPSDEERMPVDFPDNIHSCEEIMKLG